jgi:hypothetical protein
LIRATTLTLPATWPNKVFKKTSCSTLKPALPTRADSMLPHSLAGLVVLLYKHSSSKLSSWHTRASVFFGALLISCTTPAHTADMAA